MFSMYKTHRFYLLLYYYKIKYFIYCIVNMPKKAKNTKAKNTDKNKGKNTKSNIKSNTRSSTRLISKKNY